MISSYLKIATRTFFKDRFYSVVNVLGLTVGISAVFLITLFIVYETNYDRFHQHSNRIYRMVTHFDVNGSTNDLNSVFPPLANALATSVPEIEKAVRLHIENGVFFKYDDKVFAEEKILYADPNFFDVFSFHVLAGNPNKALEKPNQVLLTPSLALKYFNTQDWASVVGQSITMNQEVYEVTGVVDHAPGNSHLQFNAVASMQSIPRGRDETWNSVNVATYLLLREDANIQSVISKIPGVLSLHMKNYDKLAGRGIIIQPFVQHLYDIHLRSNIQGEFEPAGSETTLYIFGSVGLVVLLLACVNFINLVTARSANRAKEVGVRKVMGSGSALLSRQFIFESTFIVAIATLLALGMVELMRVPFAMLSGRQLPFDILISPTGLLLILIFIFVLGVLAGSYPAFYLSSFQPAAVLKGKVRSGFQSGKLRNTLVLIQFVISIVLITCTLIVQQQLDFVRSQKLGFDKENVLIIDNADRLSNQEAFIASVSSVAGVKGMGSASTKPIKDVDGMLIVLDKSRKNDPSSYTGINYSLVDHSYLDVLQYQFLEGRNFSKDVVSDERAAIINETAALSYFGGEAIGKKFSLNGSGNDIPEYTIIGVVKDFNFKSLKSKIGPLAFYLKPNQRFLHVRLEPGNYATTIAAIEKIWKQSTSELPFSYSFLDEDYDALYKEETNLGRLFNVFTALALFIACLGLMGLAAYTAEQRKKEISVRKVLGASVRSIIQLLSKSFIGIIMMAFVLATPIAYYLMTQWLNSFAYKTDITTPVLMVGGITVLVIAMLAVSYQSIRAALVNPAKTLKEE